jgi:hypothetical protein
LRASVSRSGTRTPSADAEEVRRAKTAPFPTRRPRSRPCQDARTTIFGAGIRTAGTLGSPRGSCPPSSRRVFPACSQLGRSRAR